MESGKYQPEEMPSHLDLEKNTRNLSSGGKGRKGERWISLRITSSPVWLWFSTLAGKGRNPEHIILYHITDVSEVQPGLRSTGLQRQIFGVGRWGWGRKRVRGQPGARLPRPQKSG